MSPMSSFWWLSASASRRADSVMNSPYSDCSLPCSASLRAWRICVRWVTHEVENDANPPVAASARAERAEM